MLKKLTTFSFLCSLIIFIILLILNPFVSKSIIEGVTNAIESCYVKDNIVINIENIDQINFEAVDITKVSVVETGYKSKEMLIKYHSILGNIPEYVCKTEDDNIYILQNTIKNKSVLPDLINLLTKFDDVQSSVTIFIPKDMKLSLNGNTYYSEKDNY
ncbi:MAG: hypothetical protein R3Y29_03955 [bacterium]